MAGGESGCIIRRSLMIAVGRQHGRKNMLRTGTCRRNRGLVVCCVLLLFALAPMTLSAQAPPSADALSTAVSPKPTSASVGSLNVGPGSTSYVEFNLSGIPAGGHGGCGL